MLESPPRRFKILVRKDLWQKLSPPWPRKCLQHRLSCLLMSPLSLLSLQHKSDHMHQAEQTLRS